MNTNNIVMFDSNRKEAEDFIRGLNESTNSEWKALICTANRGRKTKISNIVRYSKYFLFPMKVFLNRNKYNIIIGWQAFYGLIFAFYCRIFQVKKSNVLLIKNFTYKPKKGAIGKLYFWFMNFIVKSEYVDIFVCTSKTFCEYCARAFNEPSSRFVFLPFGINDFAKNIDMTIPSTNDYILSLGRSNRDWNFLIESLAKTKYQVRIVCDELRRDNLPSNIKVYNSVWGKETYEFLKNCKLIIIPILDGKIGSGETVLLQAMSFSKPIIITKPSCLADDYVINEKTGLVVYKKRDELLNAVDRIWSDEKLCERLSCNCRKIYEEKHSLRGYGRHIGKLLVERGCVK